MGHAYHINCQSTIGAPVLQADSDTFCSYSFLELNVNMSIKHRAVYTPRETGDQFPYKTGYPSDRICIYWPNISDHVTQSFMSGVKATTIFCESITKHKNCICWEEINCDLWVNDKSQFVKMESHQ